MYLYFSSAGDELPLSCPCGSVL